MRRLEYGSMALKADSVPSSVSGDWDRLMEYLGEVDPGGAKCAKCGEELYRWEAWNSDGLCGACFAVERRYR